MKNFSVEYFVEMLAKFVDNRVSEERVVEWMTMAINKVESDYASVKLRCEETGYHEESPEEIELGLSALENYRESLGLLEDYLEYGEMELLNEAAGLAVQANHLFVAAAQENQRVLDEVEINLCF